MTFFPPLCILLCSNPFIIHSGEYIDIYYLQCPFLYTMLHLRFCFLHSCNLPTSIHQSMIHNYTKFISNTTFSKSSLISTSPLWFSFYSIYLYSLIHYLYQKIRFSFNNFDEIFLISQIKIYFQIYRKTYYLHIVCIYIKYIPIFKISTRNLLWFDLCIFSFTSFFTQHPSFHLIGSQQF